MYCPLSGELLIGSLGGIKWVLIRIIQTGKIGGNNIVVPVGLMVLAVIMVVALTVGAKLNINYQNNQNKIY